VPFGSRFTEQRIWLKALWSIKVRAIEFAHEAAFIGSFNFLLFELNRIHVAIGLGCTLKSEL
jgi:hypothetical protein